MGEGLPHVTDALAGEEPLTRLAGTEGEKRAPWLSRVTGGRGPLHFIFLIF